MAGTVSQGAYWLRWGKLHNDRPDWFMEDVSKSMGTVPRGTFSFSDTHKKKSNKIHNE